MKEQGVSARLGWIETTKQATDKRRVMWVKLDGQMADLPPIGIPPIITGVAVDNKRVLVDDGSGIPVDIMPGVIGLTAQGFASIQTLFKK